MNRLYITRIALSALSFLYALNSQATEANDSVDTYNNHTVSTTVSVQGRTVLNTTNVAVTPQGKLTMSAPQGVSVTGPFSVLQGGTLQLNGGRQYTIKFHYDNTGNQVRRINR
jgi:hypothetical protein